MMTPGGSFDAWAADYDRALAQGVSLSGEDKEYFAEGRVRWLARCLDAFGAQARDVLDFGCGTGTNTEVLGRTLRARVVGVDPSEASIQVARARHPDATLAFERLVAGEACERFDLAFCNGVFHHIPLAERGPAVRHVYASLRPGGIFALWENNPWNPGTRLVMRRIPFDRDALLLAPGEARRLLRAAGFEIVSTTYQFIFPHGLRLFRPAERIVAGLPFGAQYQALGRKPQAGCGSTGPLP
jgi:SAM-dependent methyltransferase